VLADIGIILLLLLLNGFFAMAELAIVSARRAHLRKLVEEKKSRGASLALEMAEHPNSFLSTVQIGVTLNSILTGAFSGATFAKPLGDFLNQFAVFAPYGSEIAFVGTVAIVGYLTLVIGELVPKRLGLAYAEIIAVPVALVMNFLAKGAAPVVWVLNKSTELFIRLIRLHGSSAVSVTEEEVKDLIAEGTQKGVFKQAEKEMLEGVMRLADWTVRTIMTPRIDMMWLGIEDKVEENIKEICASGYSRLPVARGDMEEILGIVYAKDLLNMLLRGEPIDVQATMRPALIVPDTTSVLRLLDLFKESSQHLAIIIDEYGSIEGLVTATDVLESITGALPDGGQESDEKPVQREDGSWLIDGMTPVDEVEMIIGVKNLHDSGEYHTLAGFMIDKLGRIPTAGDHFQWGASRFEVVDMDGRRVDKVLVNPDSTATKDEEEID
jgi:putative hemolysin